jgi:hypothetical protein
LKDGGVVGGVGAGPEFAERAAGGAGGAAHGGEEFRFIDVGRAGGGDQGAAGAQAGQGGGVEAGVGVDGAGAFGFAAGERRGIDDDEVEVFLGWAGQPGEGVGLHGVVRAGGDGMGYSAWLSAKLRRALARA